MPFIIAHNVSNAAVTTIYNANAPFAFRIIDAWLVCTGGTDGTWQLDDGVNAITTAINIGADTSITRAESLDDTQWIITANGSLRSLFSVATDDGIVFIMGIKCADV